MRKILVFAIMLVIIYVAAFFIPGGVDRFSLDPEKLSEFWRFITYSFIHLNLMHLFENIGGLALIVFIALELKTAFSDFSSTYISSGVLSAVPLWLIFPFTALGASNAVFGGFGLISQELKKLKIKTWAVILLLAVTIFIRPIIYFLSRTADEQIIFSLKQSIAHFSGLLFGIAFFYLLVKIKPILTKRKRFILRGDY